VLGFRPSRGVAPLVVIAKFFETLSQDQFEKCQQDWKNDWIGKVVSFAFAWYIFVQFLVAMRNATDEQNAAISYLIFFPRIQSPMPLVLHSFGAIPSI
jgi:hypothetical protein